MNKHTPGPWHHEYDAGGKTWQVVCSPLDDVLCLVLTDDVDAPISGHDGEANARLFAAAPDLLEAVEAFIDLADFSGSEAEHDEALGKAYELATNAMCKAIGEIR